MHIFCKRNNFKTPPNKKMLLSSTEIASKPIETNSSPRISFSSDFLDERNFITISPQSNMIAKTEQEMERERARQAEFEFLSMGNSKGGSMITADELIFDGKLLPFWQVQECEKLGKISLKGKDEAGEVEVEVEMEMEEVINNKEEPRVWFVDDDPSPRPPKCTVLWKELLKLKKQRASALTPSSSSSSSSSTNSMGDLPPIEEGKEESRAGKHIKRIKRGLERTRSATIRIRPMVNVPICTQGKNNSQLPPFFSPKKGGRLER